VKIKREDLFEVVVFTQQRVPQRPKQNKNTRFIPKGWHNLCGKFFVSLLAQERKQLKSLKGFSEIKKEY
jgi:hypothetical protein